LELCLTVDLAGSAIPHCDNWNLTPISEPGQAVESIWWSPGTGLEGFQGATWRIKLAPSQCGMDTGSYQTRSCAGGHGVRDCAWWLILLAWPSRIVMFGIWPWFPSDFPSEKRLRNRWAKNYKEQGQGQSESALVFSNRGDDPPW